MVPEENDSGDKREPAINQTFDTETPASFAVVQAIAAMENVNPVEAPEELGITLYDYVDPEALDTIVAKGPEKGEVRVKLPIEEYQIEITDSDRIRVFQK